MTVDNNTKLSARVDLSNAATETETETETKTEAEAGAETETWPKRNAAAASVVVCGTRRGGRGPIGTIGQLESLSH